LRADEAGFGAADALAGAVELAVEGGEQAALLGDGGFLRLAEGGGGGFQRGVLAQRGGDEVGERGGAEQGPPGAWDVGVGGEGLVDAGMGGGGWPQR
jgi:hypothetical protein